MLDTNGDGKLDMSDDMYTPYYPGDEWVDWVGMSIFHFSQVSHGPGLAALRQTCQLAACTAADMPADGQVEAAAVRCWPAQECCKCCSKECASWLPA